MQTINTDKILYWYNHLKLFIEHWSEILFGNVYVNLVDHNLIKVTKGLENPCIRIFSRCDPTYNPLLKIEIYVTAVEWTVDTETSQVTMSLGTGTNGGCHLLKSHYSKTLP